MYVPPQPLPLCEGVLHFVVLHLIPQRKQINSPLRFLLKELYIIKTDANKGHFLNQPGSHVISACFSHLSLSQSPQNPHPCPISPYQ